MMRDNLLERKECSEGFGRRSQPDRERFCVFVPPSIVFFLFLYARRHGGKKDMKGAGNEWRKDRIKKKEKKEGGVYGKSLIF